VIPEDCSGKASCFVVEALPHPTQCDQLQGRIQMDPHYTRSTREALARRGLCGGAGQPACDGYSLCELQQAGPECHHAAPYLGTPGWCYIDPAQNPDDDPSLVRRCRRSNRRILRFVDPGSATPAPDATMLIACWGDLPEGPCPLARDAGP
jgi:hypothetical protein